MIKTVIFDMDGVIVDTEPVHHHAYQQHFSALNIQVSDLMYASFTGNSTKNIYEKLKLQFDLDQSINELVETKRAFFDNAFENKKDLDLLDGVLNLIQDLHQNNIQMVLASSSAKVTIEKIFDRFNLHPYFSHKVSGEDFPKSKPHPAIFEKAALLSNTDIKECIVIEDSTNGVIAANAAGIFCVGYNSLHSKLQDLTTADLIIQEFKELNFQKIKTLR